VVIAYRQMLKQQIDIVQQGGDPMNVIRDAAENVPWTPTLEGWPTATIEAATPGYPGAAAGSQQLPVQFPQSVERRLAVH
jgi:hypothetical protein